VATLDDERLDAARLGDLVLRIRRGDYGTITSEAPPQTAKDSWAGVAPPRWWQRRLAPLRGARVLKAVQQTRLVYKGPPAFKPLAC
jgi:hypothetical protein